MLDIARQLASRRVKENIDARRCIKSKYLNLECDLQQSKWFAYRFMSPWQATRKFALAYNDFYQRSFARHFDRNAKVQPVDWTEFGKPCRSMTHLWIGRQSADRLGMPYGAYLEFFDDFNMRRTRKHLPRPNQIEGSSEAQKLWPSKLAEFLMERAWNELARINTPQLHVGNYRKLSAQDAFRQWAVTAVRSSSLTYEQAMGELSYRRCLLPPDTFRAMLGDEVYDDRRQRLEADRRAGRIVSENAETLCTAAYWPSCFGFRRATENASSPCQTCPFTVDCHKVEVKIAALITADPTMMTADDLKRKSDRERQASHRKKRGSRVRLLG
jgi:hypothetical protein